MVLKQTEFTFEEYPHEGLSGIKFLATRKRDGKKFIVKHQVREDVINEFINYSVAHELGLKTPEFYLFERDECGKLFKSWYAIAIEFIDIVEPRGAMNPEGGTINWSDYYSFIAMKAALLHTDDYSEIVRCKDGYLYFIDTAESLSFNATSDVIFAFIKNFYDHGQVHYKDYDGWGDFYIETINKLADLPTQKISKFLDKLCEVFPLDIKGLLKTHFLDYFDKCQVACKKFINNLK